jgi:hypothetical protein
MNRHQDTERSAQGQRRREKVRIGRVLLWAGVFGGVAELGWRQSLVYEAVPAPAFQFFLSRWEQAGCPDGGFGISKEGTLIGFPVKVELLGSKTPIWLSTGPTCSLLKLPSPSQAPDSFSWASLCSARRVGRNSSRYGGYSCYHPRCVYLPF